MKLSKSAIDRVVQKHKDSGESSVDTIKDAQLPDNAAWYKRPYPVRLLRNHAMETGIQ